MNLEEINKSISPYKVIRRDIINSSLNMNNPNGKYLVFLSPDANYINRNIAILYYCEYKKFDYNYMLSELNLFVSTPRANGVIKWGEIEKHQDVLSYKIREYYRKRKIARICGQ